MRKIVAVAMLCGAVLAANAVPARRGWQTRTQADGSTVEVQLLGDEYYHYLVNRDGQQVREVNGMYEVVGEAPTPEVAKARHAAAKARRAPLAASDAEFGYTPYLPPKGVVIMVNYSDTKFKTTTTKEVIDELCNSNNCTVNKYNGVNYGSIAQYFRDQSDGKYNLQLDVYGPVTLDKGYAYYGQDYQEEGNDRYSGDVIIEACKKMDSEIDFSKYDWNNDGKVDFVYVVYAGKGQADGGSANTIWPHSYDIESSRYYGNCTYSESQCKFDGKLVHAYAMSNELSESSLAGVGIICHEYGHVIGLPDHYDTDYSTNYNNSLTPNEWDVMDGGSYNGGIHCPPNYNAWEKAFCGWYTPANLGSDGQNLELKALGTDGYAAYQINASGNQQAVTTNNSLNYYIENRQQQGWDTYLPYHGLLIWKVNYNKSMWENNAPNLTSNGSPHFTLVPSSGTKIGADYGTKNVWPYSTKTSWTGVSGKPLKNIKESNGVITLTYIEEPVIPVEPFDVTFMSNGTQWATTQSTGKLVLPAAPACECKEFVGWTKTKDYASATTAPTLATAGDAVAEGATFYAVFAEKNENAKLAVEDELTLATTGVSGTNYAVWSGKQASSDAVYAGHSAGGNDAIQLRSRNSSSGIVTTASGGTLSKVVVAWNANTEKGRILDIYGKNTAYTAASDLYGDNKGTKLGSLAMGSTTLEITGNYEYIGFRSNNGAVYLDKITVLWQGTGAAYSNYTTAYTCTQTDVEAVRQTKTPEPKTRKVIENGQVLILRDGVRYNLLGQPVR